jgi:hypothetical protein
VTHEERALGVAPGGDPVALARREPAQVVERDADQRVVGPQGLLADRQGALEQRASPVEALQPLPDHRLALEAPGDVGMLLAKRLRLDLARALEELEGTRLVVLGVPGEAPEEHERHRHARSACAERGLADGEGVLERRTRLGVLVARQVQRPELEQALADARIRVAEERARAFDRVLRVRQRLRAIRRPAAPQRLSQPGLEQRSLDRVAGCEARELRARQGFGRRKASVVEEGAQLGERGGRARLAVRGRSLDGWILHPSARERDEGE